MIVMIGSSDVCLDLAAELGANADTAAQQLTLYIPDRDRAGAEIGTQRRWVLEASALLAEIGGGVTVLPPVEGGWLDPATGAFVWERPVQVYTFVRPEAFAACLPRLRAFLHQLGVDIGQGEVVAEFDGCLYRITEFEEV